LWPASVKLRERAQSKRDLKSSEMAEAALAREPETVPGFGAVADMVKTSGSAIELPWDTGRLESFGKRT
jgi:hypothetical protein